MEDKVNAQAILRYSQQYSRKILDHFFAQKKFITGEELLRLSEVAQVNLFIIQHIFKNWKKTMQASRSVFFDYESTHVQAAEQNLMNILSRNIQLDAATLEPILVSSVTQTLNDVLNPYDFFTKLITTHNDSLSVAEFREDLKYIKLNSAPLLRLAQILEEKRIAVVSGNEAFSILDKILEELNFSPEDIDPLLEVFNKVVPVTLDDFFEPKKNVSIQPLPSKEQKTIGDNFQKINIIKESLTINQKFMFTKALFAGDFEKFSEAIQELDSCNHFDEAMTFLQKFLQQWDQESEEFHEFMELIEKRFN